MKPTGTPRRLQFRIAVAFALNIVLWLYVRTHPGITGNVDEDAPQFFLEGCLAASATVPCVMLLQTGRRWQKAAALVFLALPAKSLFLIGIWAIQHW